MQERDLIVAVLAAQSGFATPAQVIAAAAGLDDAEADSLLARLERTGALDGERRRIIEALVERALAADAKALAASLGHAPTLAATLASVGAQAAPEADVTVDVPPERPGQYARLHELGRGSQSVVRAARDRIVGREVALKELRAASGEGSGAGAANAARFLREVRLIASLEHPGIVAVHELARREDGTLFCAEKLVRGETLRARLARCGSLEDRLRLLRHVVDACQAVAYAHDKRIIHRDLKPGNVMVGEYGETVVVDWGLARRRDEKEELVPMPTPSVSTEPALTAMGVALGTPAYMSPEQARGDVAAIDERSDVFSLGAMLYEVLTGRPPFAGTVADEVLAKVRAGSFPPVRALVRDAPPELAAIAERALRPNPADRYADATALAEELSTYSAGGRVRAYDYGAWELLRKFAAGHRALMTGLAVGLGALVITAVTVAVRLYVARGDLARAFVERARIAESQSDWGLAAGYFAAARTQHDTAEARWGVALAEDRAVERTLSIEGPPESYTDVGVLADGRAVVLSAGAHRVEVRELDGGKLLWGRDVEVIHDTTGSAVFSRDQIRVRQQGGWAYLDAATGKEGIVWNRESMGRPCDGPSTALIGVRNQQLVVPRQGQPELVLAPDVTPFKPECTVSDDGTQVAYRDTGDRVHLLSLPDGRELAQRPGKGVRNLLFSRHGLILVRQGWIDSMGAPGGDFSIALGEAAFTLDYPTEAGGSGLLPDGERVIVSRLGSSRADVVDLRARSVVSVLHYPTGWPRFAFSSDGQRVFAAGLGRNSQLVAWRLPRDRTPTGHPGSWFSWSASFFPTCCRMAIAEDPSGTVDVFGPQGELLGRDPIPEGIFYYPVEDGVFLYSAHGGNFVLRDVEQHRDLWSCRCPGCGTYFRVSRDRMRAAYSSVDGFLVWDAAADRVLFRDAGAKSTRALALSHDGDRAVWESAGTIHIRDLASGRERQLTLDGEPEYLDLGPDAKQLAAVIPGGLSLWDVASGRALWSVKTMLNGPYDLHWSADRRSLLLDGPGGAVLFDAANGERLARFPREPGVTAVVRPDLQAKLVASSTNWELVPLPRPIDAPPAEALERTLRKMGLALDGAEIVAAP